MASRERATPDRTDPVASKKRILSDPEFTGADEDAAMRADEFVRWPTCSTSVFPFPALKGKVRRQRDLLPHCKTRSRHRSSAKPRQVEAAARAVQRPAARIAFPQE